MPPLEVEAEMWIEIVQKMISASHKFASLALKPRKSDIKRKKKKKSVGEGELKARKISHVKKCVIS